MNGITELEKIHLLETKADAATLQKLLMILADAVFLVH